MPVLLLVDGSSYMYRAFHALPNLRNQSDEPIGALYGMISMLRRLSNEIRAEYRACIFDANGPTFRNALYMQYKAHRLNMPHELMKQIPEIYAAVRALGWHILVENGVEADDVIGTLSRQAEFIGYKVVILTSDKDLAQLVTEHITLIDTMTNKELNLLTVKDKFGVIPALIPDYLSLVGDTADNIPGVKKVGPKTAKKWLESYGNLSNIIEHATEFKGILGDNLRACLGFFPISQALTRIRTDVPLSSHVISLQSQREDQNCLREIFRRNGFKKWLEKIEER